MGWDLRSGLDAATGDVIVLIDGDSQNPVDDVLKLYALMRRDRRRRRQRPPRLSATTARTAE